MKWVRKRFTFMVIPDANSSVIRFQLSALVMMIVLLIIVAITASAITVYLLYKNSDSQVAKLENQLAMATGQYEQIIQNKDDHINELQTEIVGLSAQAKSIDSHMSDIKELETQLKEMVGIEEIDTASATMMVSSGVLYDDTAMDGGTGGEELPVTDEGIAQLIGDTRSKLAALSVLAQQLKPKLEQTKNEVLQAAAKLRVTPTIWPTDSRKLTSSFGVRKDPFTKRARFHSGLDIGGNRGDPIYASADGVVISADRDSSHGWNIWISHSGGIRTHYSHLSKMHVQKGDKVSKGDLIGEMGSSGRSTGPHLHYEITVNGEYVDPEPYLKASRKGS